MSNHTQPKNSARVRQVNFWKKHQTILQHCADLSETCNVKILCIMAVPDTRGNNNNNGSPNQNSFEWTESQGNSAPATTRLHANFSDSNTIIFDSFSNEEEVKQRNTALNNISKINDPRRRFAADFNVKVTGKVTTILSASTVSDYRVVDERRSSIQQQHAAMVAKPIATFSSIISAAPIPSSDGASTNGSPLRLQGFTSPSLTDSSETTATPIAPHVSDNDLIASLVAASAEPVQLTINNELMASLTALSAVATQQSNSLLLSPSSSTSQSSTLSSSSTPQSSTLRTDQLRKRCHGLLQQRGGPTSQPRQNMVIALLDERNRNLRSASNITTIPTTQPLETFSHISSAHVTSPCTTSLPTPDSGSFFVSIPRPAEVHQTLLLSQTTQVGRKRDRDYGGDQLPGSPEAADGTSSFQRNQVDEDGHAIHGGGSGFAISGLAIRNLSNSFFSQDIDASPPSGIPVSSLGSVADAYPGDCDNHLTGAPATPTKRSALASLHEELTPSPTGMRNPVFPIDAPASAAMSSAFTPLAGFYRRIILPPMVVTDLESMEYHPFHQPRISSSDINFNSMAMCPMSNDAACLNFSDIKFRRSSEEITALCALAELGGTKK